MNVSNALNAGSLAVTGAILLHGLSRPQPGRSNDTARIATLHPVSDGAGGRPVIGAGRVIDSSDLATVVRGLAGGRGLPFLSGNVLASNANTMVWWRPSAPARVWFNVKKDERLGKRTGITPQPSLVFVVKGERFSVFAVKGQERPTPQTMLFQAPYMNVNEAGAICVGQANVPKSVSPEAIAGFEEAFFSSRFTHPNVHIDARLVKRKGGSHALWADLLDGKHRKFPEAVLVPLSDTLGSLLTSYAQ